MYIINNQKLGENIQVTGYCSLVAFACIFAGWRMVFNPSANSSIELFLYLIWEGPLPQASIILSSAVVLFVEVKKNMLWNIKSLSKLCCLGGIVICVPIILIGLMSCIFCPISQISITPSSIQNSIWEAFFPILNGKLMMLIIAISAFVGGCLWGSIAFLISSFSGEKSLGFLFSVLLFHVLNSIVIGSNSPFLSPYYLMFPNLLSNIPIYISIAVQVIFAVIILSIFRKQNCFVNMKISEEKRDLLFKSVLIILTLLYAYVCMKPVFSAAVKYGYRINILEPLCYLFSTDNSIYVLNTLCIALITLLFKKNTAKFSNAFWSLKYVLYIFGFYFGISLILCLVFSPTAYINNDWSQFTYYFTHTNLANLLDRLQITFSPVYISIFSPLKFILTSIILVGLYSTVCVTAIYTLSKRLKLGESVFIVLLLQEIWIIMTTLNTYIQLISPFAHAIIGNHSFGFDYKPTVLTSICILILATTIILLINHLFIGWDKIYLRFASKRLENKTTRRDLT